MCASFKKDSARAYANDSRKSSLPVPLVERNIKLSATILEIFEWRTWARNYAKTASACKQSSLMLPSLSCLLVEIDWIVADVVAIQDWPKKFFHDIAARDLREDLRNSRFHCSSIDYLRDNAVPLREGLDELRALWNTRLRYRVPLQYLTATSYWRELVLVVTPAVLIPRPETELLVDIIKSAIHEKPSLVESPWVDLGTGSGALAISIAAEISKVKHSLNPAQSSREEEVIVHAVELCPRAAAIARHNVSRYRNITGGGSGGVSVYEGSWFRPLEVRGLTATVGCGTFAGIVSNPPYIPSKDFLSLQPEVRCHEPWIALEGGPGPGLDALISVCTGAAVHLLGGGFLALETNGGRQAHEVAELLEHMGLQDTSGCDKMPIFEKVKVHRDYNGTERFVSAWKIL